MFEPKPEYFLNLKTLKVEKEYFGYEILVINLNTNEYFNCILKDGEVFLEKKLINPLRACIQNKNTNSNICISIYTEEEKIDTFIAHTLITKVLETLSEDRKKDFRDYLVVPRSIEKNVVGTITSLVDFVNCEPKINSLQIKIFDKTKKDGINFVERF